MLFTSKRKWVIKETMKGLGLTKREAVKRVDALLKSGILKEGSPDDRWTQMRIENFLRFDLSNLDYKAVFMETMNFPALVEVYDEMKGQHLGKTLVAMKNEDCEFAEVKQQIELFDKFFCEHIWNYFPNVQKFPFA